MKPPDPQELRERLITRRDHIAAELVNNTTLGFLTDAEIAALTKERTEICDQLTQLDRQEKHPR